MNGQVLLIEDEPNIIEAIKFILSRAGWDVATHSNGVDAAEVVRARAPDILILDVMLPGRSGYDILRELRDDPGFADLQGFGRRRMHLPDATLRHLVQYQLGAALGIARAVVGGQALRAARRGPVAAPRAD